MALQPHTTKAGPPPTPWTSGCPFCVSFFTIKDVWDKGEKACLPVSTLPYGSTIEWVSRKMSFVFPSIINVFPSPPSLSHCFFWLQASPFLSLGCSAVILSLHWLVSMLNIVRISCSLSWHCFLKETFPSLVQAKEFLPWGESWSADWKHAWLLV